MASITRGGVGRRRRVAPVKRGWEGRKLVDLPFLGSS